MACFTKYWKTLSSGFSAMIDRQWYVLTLLVLFTLHFLSHPDASQHKYSCNNLAQTKTATLTQS